MEEMLTCSRSPFSQVFGRQGQLMQATVQSLNSLNDQIANFMVTGPKPLEQEEHAFIPPEKETLQKSMTLMRHLLVDAQVQGMTYNTLKREKKRIISDKMISPVLQADI
ncbi:hypothetical protein PAMP_011855 [Pampus punctatissimus]